MYHTVHQDFPEEGYIFKAYYGEFREYVYIVTPILSAGLN